MDISIFGSLFFWNIFFLKDASLHGLQRLIKKKVSSTNFFIEKNAKNRFFPIIFSLFHLKVTKSQKKFGQIFFWFIQKRCAFKRAIE